MATLTQLSRKAVEYIIRPDHEVILISEHRRGVESLVECQSELKESSKIVFSPRGLSQRQTLSQEV